MRKTPGKTAEERERYWTEVIEQGRKYSGGVTAYCQDNGVSKTNYYAWFHRLRVNHPDWHDLSTDRGHRKGREQAQGKGKAQPETEVAEKARRRKFTGRDKARILREADAAGAGQVAGILRREGIYASQLQKWRFERDEGSLGAKKRGRKADPAVNENKKLKLKLARMEKKLEQANLIIEVQKKIAQIMETAMGESDEKQ
jgi:transposase-like protein